MSDEIEKAIKDAASELASDPSHIPQISWVMRKHLTLVKSQLTQERDEAVKALDQVATIDIPRIHAECRQEIISQGILLQNQLHEARLACAAMQSALGGALTAVQLVHDHHYATYCELPTSLEEIHDCITNHKTIGADLMSELERHRKNLKIISEYDGESIWSDSRDDAADCMLEIAKQSITPKEPTE